MSGVRRASAIAALVTLLLGVLGVVALARVALAGASVSPAESLVQTGTKLSGHEGAAERLGSTVALSADGTTGLVGSPRAGAGAAYVINRSAAGTWSLGQQLGPGGTGGDGECAASPEDEAEDCLSRHSVALSSDGQTALVGAPRAPAPCTTGGIARTCAAQGEAWVFARSGATWTLQATLTGGVEETPGGHFGHSVALSGDGSTAVVGAPADENGHGGAWVFKRSGSSWTQDGTALASRDGSMESRFGGSVALSDDGTTALIGGPGDSSYAGAAWVFVRTPAGWSQQGSKLDGGVEETGTGAFGSSVAISANGAIALIGAHHDDDGKGAAWTFVRSGESWSSVGPKLTPAFAGDGPDEFGYSVALSADGSSALIGAPQTNGFAGQVWLFRQHEGGWGSPADALEVSEETGKGSLGASVAISADAASALVGGPSDDSKTGAVWALERGTAPPPAVSGLAPASGSTSGGTAVTIAGTHLGNATQVTFGGQPVTYRVSSPTSITATSPSGSGTVDVTVQTPAGASAANAADRFTYTSFGPQRNPSEDEPPQAGSNVAPESGLLGFGSVRGPAPVSCVVRLLSSRLPVHAHGRVAVRLRAAGSGRCRGKLTLTVIARHRRAHAGALRLGTSMFSLPVGIARTANLTLDSAGRALLSAGHGSLKASLSVGLPSGRRSANVRLIAVRRLASARSAPRSSTH